MAKEGGKVKKRMDEWEKNELKYRGLREVKGSDEEQKHGLGEEEKREKREEKRWSVRRKWKLEEPPEWHVTCIPAMYFNNQHLRMRSVPGGGCLSLVLRVTNYHSISAIYWEDSSLSIELTGAQH